MVYVDRSDLADQHQPRPKLDPEQESFVKDMVLPEHGFQPPAVRVFVGYLGLSPRGLPNTGAKSGAASLPGDWVRLYRTLDFVDFIEVEWQNVVYHKKSTAAMLPIEGTILWVRNDATIWHSQSRAQSVAASDFLRGPIADQQLPAAQASPASGQVAIVDTPSWGSPC